MDLRYIDAAELEKSLGTEELVDKIEAAFRGSAQASARSHLDVGNGSLLLMPAWAPGKYTGAKLVTIHPENRRKGLPTVHGLYTLFDGQDGRPLAVLDGGVLTLKRTAATSALAAKYLAREDAATHLMIGAGALAPYLVRAMRCVHSIERVLIWNRSDAARDELVRTLRAEGCPAEAAEDLEGAIRQSDIISTATQSCEPLVHGAFLAPGTHLDLVGAYAPDMTESDGEALAGARIVVDTWEGARAEAGDLIQAVEKGHLAWDDVSGDLAGLVRGECSGRASAAEITVFKSVGASIEDLAAAVLAWEISAANL
ncbi:MAG: alanine dehydrogenase [Rhodothermales bacterium]|jgi:alanine dehydrogenase